ncbi:hypothetical protein SUDANB95_02709 [Actinosynnema sp. ALI-1.44]
MEIRIVLTAPGEAEPARTVLEDLGRALDGLAGTTWAIRQKPPGFSRPFGDARHLLDVVLSSEDRVRAMAEAVEGWLRDRGRGVVLRATVVTTSVELSYPSSPGSPAAMILDLVREGRQRLRDVVKRTYLRDLYDGAVSSRVLNHLTDNSGTAVQAGVVNGDVNIYNGPAPAPHHEVPIILTVSYKVPSAKAADDGFQQLWRRRPSTHDIGIIVLVEGRTAQAVVLLGVRPVVVDFHDKVSEAHSRSSIRDFGIELDLDSRAGKPAPPRVVAHERDFPFAVTMGDPELFHFTMSVPSTCHAKWHLELDWASAGRTGTVVIPENGTFTI